MTAPMPVNVQPFASSSLTFSDHRLSMTRSLRHDVDKMQAHTVIQCRSDVQRVGVTVLPHAQSMDASLGQRIKAARTVMRIERSELARLVKMPYSTLAELEQGRSLATSKLARLAAVLKVNALWLETGRGTKHADSTKPMPSLADVTPLSSDEARLLAVYRNANPSTQTIIVKQAEQTASLTKSPSGK